MLRGVALALLLVACSAPQAAAPEASPTPSPTPWCDARPSLDFCYERLQIAGEVFLYADPTGKEDIGDGIRAYVDYPLHLVGHAYTDFGRIRGYHIGDAVRAWGRVYSVFDAVEERCGTVTTAEAPLLLHTSLEPGCGRAITVMAR